MLDFKKFKIHLTPKKISGFSVMILAFYLYFQYQSGGGTVPYVPPTGMALFVIGFYLGFSGTNFFKKFHGMILFITLAVFMSWIAWDTGLHDDIVNSQYGQILAGVTRAFTVHFLNGLGFHVSSVGDQIHFSGNSKINSLTIINACSGADTTILFLAAFALMLVDLGRKAKIQKLAICFVGGAIGTYFVSMVRIPLLGLVGYYYGYDAIETYHMYSGYLIFLSSVMIFWWLSLRWINKKTTTISSTM